MWKLIRGFILAERIVAVRAAPAAPRSTEARSMRYRRSDTDGTLRRMRELVEQNRLI
jgi:hypothetical protein